MKKILYITVLLTIAQHANAQTRATILAESAVKDPFQKKLRLGGSFNIYWSKIVGNKLPVEYYGKPSLGFDLRAEYYFNGFLGLGLGVGYQQRGSGIINVDNSGGAYSHPWVVNKYGTQGDPDSTYLEKLRFNTIEIPLTLLLRSPKPLFKGFRPSAGAGIIYLYNIESNDVFQSVTDGIHKNLRVSDYYFQHDFGYQVSLGADIDAGGNGTIFQLHFVYTSQFGNVYAANQGDGSQVTYGVRLSFLF
jgi:hypothetical protein